MVKEKNYHPRDYSMRLILSKYPKSSHKLFNMPGKFLKRLETDAFTEDGRSLHMDGAVLVDENGLIDRKSTINIEHQTNNLNQEKIDSIYDYKIHLIHETNVPSISIVITNIEQELEMKCYKSHSCVYNVYYIVIDEEKIYKKLNTLKDIIRAKKELTEEESLYFAYISIFVKNDIGHEIIEELSHLFAQARITDRLLKLHMYLVLKRMIKEICAGDDKKIKELLAMITKEISPADYEKLSFIGLFEYDLAKKDEAIEVQKETIAQRDNIISDMGDELSRKDDELSRKDDELSRKDDEIRKLKEQLTLQNKE